MEGMDLKILTGADFKSKLNHKQIITREEELMLRRYLLLVYVLLNGLTYIQTEILVCDIAIDWNKDLPVNWAKYCMGGIDSVPSFLENTTTFDRAHSFGKERLMILLLGQKFVH